MSDRKHPEYRGTPTPPSMFRNIRVLTPEEHRRLVAELEAKTRRWLEVEGESVKRPAILRIERPAASKLPQKQSFLSVWFGCLLILQSMAIGVAVFGISDPFFIVGASLFNFFIAAPLVALAYAIVIRIVWE
jgi:hypothetical protein